MRVEIWQRPTAPGQRATGPAGLAEEGQVVFARASCPVFGIMANMAEPFGLRANDECELVIHPPTDPYGDGFISKADVEVRADGLVARTNATLVPRSGREDLAAFFAEMAADWRGWKGQRRWQALEQELTIEAWHDSRANVLMAVTIRRQERAYAEDAWSARVVFAVEAGEQLAVVSSDIKSLLRV